MVFVLISIQYMKTYSLISLFFILGFTSCIPYKEIDIQYLNKPEINIPNEFNKPLVLINYYENKGSDKIKKFEYAIDSVAAEEAAASVKENLLNSPWFHDLDIPVERHIRKDSSRYIKPLPWSALNNIAKGDTADLVISLEYIRISEKSDSYRTQENDIEYYYGYISAPIYCYWRIYDLTKKQITNGYLYRDTLFWDSKDWTPVSVGNQLPGYFSAAAYAGNECGEKYAIKISPTWVNDKRNLYYVGSSEMESAAIHAVNGEWIEAALIWQRIYALKKGKLSAQAAFNLALANEMNGKFDIALEWLKDAKKLYPLPEIDKYRKILNDRLLTPNN